MKATDYAKSLRALADDIEKLDERSIYTYVRVYQVVDSLEEMRDLRRTMGGEWKKSTQDGYLSIIKHFGGERHSEIEFIIFMGSSVCEKTQVGEETVTVADPEAPQITVTRPVYEWKCPEVLA